MSERTKIGRLSPPVQIALVGAGLLVLAVAGYMLLVKPKRSEASKLDAQIADVRHQIADRRSASTVRQISVAVKTADLSRLAKAIPSDANMASVILELNDVATDAGIVFDSIAPQPAVADNGYQVQPITLTFSGNYFTLTDFLFRLRQLVQVRDGRLGVTGRLFGVQSITFSENDTRKFPFIDADLLVNAFAFGGAAAAPAGALPAPTSTTTTETATTQTTTTPEPSTANAAPNNPSS
jgi:type II secretory pathway component PulM